MLLEHPGELVTREELRQRLWSADTFVDFDRSVNAAIKRLREALGESADTPVFIETLARRGYRFIAPINGSAPSRVGPAAVTDRTKSSFVHSWAAIALFLPIVIVVLVWVVWRYPARPIEVIERRLTANSWENPVSSAAVSPDGKNIAYTDKTGMYLKLIHTGETHSVPLPTDFSAVVDNWFPDGAHLLVTRKEQSRKPSLWSISVFGGSPRKLVEDASEASLSPDGSHIAFLRAGLILDTLGLEEWVVRSDGTDPLKVASEKPGTRVAAPTWSADNKRIAYVRTNSGWAGGTSSVEVNGWQKAHAESLFSNSRLGPALFWLPDGRLAYQLGDDPQNKSVWLVSPQQSSNSHILPVRISRGPGEISQFSGSADGKVLVLLRNDSQPTVYVGTLAADGTRLLANKRLTLDDNLARPFSWTPDSKAVLYVSNRNGTPQIFKQAINQPLAETLVTSPDGHWVNQVRLTPDGSEILYILVPKYVGPETPPSSIFAIPIGGGTPRFILKDASIVNVQCARNPSTLCLYSIIKGKTLVTFKFDVRTGRSAEPPQIDPSCNWSLSPDGSQRAVIVDSTNQGKILLRSTATGKTRELAVKGWTGLVNADWSADGKSLLAPWQSYEGENALLNITLDGKASVLLKSRNQEVEWAVPSPDGHLLAINEFTSSSNVWAVENFR